MVERKCLIRERCLPRQQKHSPNPGFFCRFPVSYHFGLQKTTAYGSYFCSESQCIRFNKLLARFVVEYLIA